MTALRTNDPARMFQPTDLAKPGAIDELLSLHRAIFGGFRMEDPPAPPAYKAPETQEELNRIIGDRLAREREKFADYDDLKAKAAAHDKAVADAMSEAEKAVAAARTEGEQAAAEKANGRIIRAEARALAAETKFRDPLDAVAFLDLSKVKVSDDGEVDSKALKDQLEQLAKDKPYLVDDGKKPTPKPDRSQGGSGGSDSSGVDKGRELFEARRKKSA